MLLLSLFLKLSANYLFMGMNDAHAEAIGQLVWVGSPLHLRVSQALNSVCQGWQKVPLPTEPSHFSWY